MTEVDSSKGECPMCNLMFPMDQLCSHASYCNGKSTKSKSEPVASKRKFEEVDNNKPTFSLFMKKSKTEKNGTAKENIPITKTELGKASKKKKKNLECSRFGLTHPPHPCNRRKSGKKIKFLLF